MTAKYSARKSLCARKNSATALLLFATTILALSINKSSFEGRETAYDKLLRDLDTCSYILILHIAKTGGTTIEAAVKATMHAETDTFFGGKFGYCAHAKKVMKLFKDTNSTSQKVAVSEVPIRLMYDVGFAEVEKSTCVVISSIREPLKWAQSAFKHSMRSPAWKHDYFTATRNFQSQFLSQLNTTAIHSLTIVMFDQLNSFSVLLRRHLGCEYFCDEVLHENAGEKTAQKYAADLVKWTARENTLDLELYDFMKANSAVKKYGFLHLSLSRGDNIPDRLQKVLLSVNNSIDPPSDLREYMKTNSLNRMELEKKRGILWNAYTGAC